MKQKLWLTLVGCIAYCIDKDLYKSIDYLREQVRVLVEHQEKQNKRITLTNRQRMRIAAKAKRLSRKMLDRHVASAIIQHVAVRVAIILKIGNKLRHVCESVSEA